MKTLIAIALFIMSFNTFAVEKFYNVSTANGEVKISMDVAGSNEALFEAIVKKAVVRTDQNIDPISFETNAENTIYKYCENAKVSCEVYFIFADFE
jgi:hypothetical protein